MAEQRRTGRYTFAAEHWQRTWIVKTSYDPHSETWIVEWAPDSTPEHEWGIDTEHWGFDDDFFDEEDAVRRALWSIWFREDTAEARGKVEEKQG